MGAEVGTVPVGVAEGLRVGEEVTVGDGVLVGVLVGVAGGRGVWVGVSVGGGRGVAVSSTQLARKLAATWRALCIERTMSAALAGSVSNSTPVGSPKYHTSGLAHRLIRGQPLGQS